MAGKKKTNGLVVWIRRRKGEIKISVGTGVSVTGLHALASGSGQAIQGSFSASPGGIVAFGLMFIAVVLVLAVAVVYIVKNTGGPRA